jgi:L-amino acid N-acyltransferase YncA
MDLYIRRASEADADRIAEIYNWYVLNTVITFETSAVSPQEMRERIREKLTQFDWVVGEFNHQIVGYAYYGSFRHRAAYSHTVESTVYLARESTGKGFGKRLYSALIESASKKGFREVIGVIALPNPASLALHQALGFREAGFLRGVGHKFGEYVDVALWQRSLDAD